MKKETGGKVECIYVVAPSTVANGRKTFAGFEFGKQMKKFNDVEPRSRALPPARRPMDFRL